MRHPLRCTLPLLALLGALVTTAVPAAAAPVTKTPSRAIEAFAPYQPQTTCSPSAKPGTVALRSLIMTAYGGTGDYGIIRNCSVGGRSEHKEGRAWDWKVNVASAAQVRQVNDMLTWLLRTDAYGNRAAQARRLGVMYVIWNKRIWNANKNAWSPYTGADAHVNHVHFSLGWAGALKRTSYWTGVVSGTVRAPAAPAAPAAPVAPKPTGTGTLTVSGASPTGASSTFLLEGGTRYLLTSTGYYRYGAGGMLADAECSARTAEDGTVTWERSSAWEQDETWTGGRGHLDLQVLGESIRWSTGTDGQDCDPTTHTYRTVVEAQRTGPLTMKVLDDTYTDNGGGLKVTVTPFTWDGRN